MKETTQVASNNRRPPCGQVFVNRTLNLNSIRLIGFDMDYTLVTYNVPAFEDKAFQIVVAKLLTKGYPADIEQLAFTPGFIIRGLVIDTERGNILKVNRYGFVRRVAHGTRFLSFEEQKKEYGTTSIDLTDPRFYIIHTLFSLSEGSLYAQLVDLFDDKGAMIDYRRMFNDIRRATNDAHREEELKGTVLKNPEKFIVPDPNVTEALIRFRKFGKKLALITNSDYEYSNRVMEYCFGSVFPVPWQDMFDITVVASSKPDFFSIKNRFLRVDRATGHLSNFHGRLEWGGIYQGGNAAKLEEDFDFSPSDILYLGDHIHGDVVMLKDTIGWRTGLVVQELADEVPSLHKTSHFRADITRHMASKEELEDRLYHLKEELWALPPSERAGSKQEKEREQLRSQIEVLDHLLTDLIDATQKEFNPFWGEVMRAGNEESRFATLVERYACIYMASIGDLARHSPFKYFRPRRRFLAHDPMPTA